MNSFKKPIQSLLKHGKINSKAVIFVLIYTLIFTSYNLYESGNKVKDPFDKSLVLLLPESQKYVYKNSKVGNTFCNDVKAINKSNLKTFLDSFYSGSKLNYGQYLEIHNNQTDNKNKIMSDLCLNNLFVCIDELKSVYTPLKEHKNLMMKKFKNNNNFLPLKSNLCQGKRCKLTPFSNQPFNKDIVRNTEAHIDESILLAELENLKNFGYANKDDDLENLQFIKNYFSSNKSMGLKVPNIVHYVWFSCHEYRISDYLCMLSSLRFQNPEFILLHGDCEPDGKYWELFKQAAGNKLKLIKKTPPDKIFGNKITALEHKSDVARMQVLLQVGGMYFDTDTMVLKSLDDLRRDSDIVLGKATPISLANGGILASKDSWFLKKWFLEYQSFKATDGPSPGPGEWGKNSVQVPFVLWKLFPEKIRVIEVHMFRPSWDVHLLFDGLIDWSDHWTIHLSTRNMPEADKRRTLSQFALLETTYGELARHVLWGSPSLKDVGSWILHPDFDKL